MQGLTEVHRDTAKKRGKQETLDYDGLNKEIGDMIKEIRMH